MWLVATDLDSAGLDRFPHYKKLFRAAEKPAARMGQDELFDWQVLCHPARMLIGARPSATNSGLVMTCSPVASLSPLQTESPLPRSPELATHRQLENPAQLSQCWGQEAGMQRRRENHTCKKLRIVFEKGKRKLLKAFWRCHQSVRRGPLCCVDIKG